MTSSRISAKRSRLTFPRSPQACPAIVYPSQMVRVSLEARARRRTRRVCTGEARTALRWTSMTRRRERRPLPPSGEVETSNSPAKMDGHTRGRWQQTRRPQVTKRTSYSHRRCCLTPSQRPPTRFTDVRPTVTTQIQSLKKP